MKWLVYDKPWIERPSRNEIILAIIAFMRNEVAGLNIVAVELFLRALNDQPQQIIMKCWEIDTLSTEKKIIAKQILEHTKQHFDSSIRPRWPHNKQAD